MTEREYIEYLRLRADAYIAHISGKLDRDTIDNWCRARNALSAHTLRALCDVWLEHDNGSRAEIDACSHGN